MKRFTVKSFNSLGNTVWTDGYEHLPLLLDCHEIRRCCHCGAIYSRDAVTPMGELLTPDDDVPWEIEPEQRDYFYAIETGLARSGDNEIKYRFRVWWMANDRIRSAVRAVHDKEFWRLPDDIIEKYADLVEAHRRDVDSYFDNEEEAQRRLVASYPSLSEALRAAHRRQKQKPGWPSARVEALISRIESFPPDDPTASLRSRYPWRATQSAASSTDVDSMLRAEDLYIADELISSLVAPSTPFPEPSGELTNLPYELTDCFQRKNPRAILRGLVSAKRKEIREHDAIIAEFRYTNEERECLLTLAAHLDGKDDAMLAELLRQLGSFDAAIGRSSTVTPTDVSTRRRQTVLLQRCREKVSAVQVVDPVPTPAWAERFLSSANHEPLADRIVAALTDLLEQDNYLLRVDASERTITHRLATHLQRYFPTWDVDCEYNRDGHDPKEIPQGSGDDGEHGSRVYPDVIIHHRGTSDNLAVLEIKKSSNRMGDERDFAKLRGYRAALGYRLAIFVRLAVGEAGADVEHIRIV